MEEAATVLGTTVDTVRSFMRRGILRPHYPQGKGWRKDIRFHAEEVSALAEVREMKLSPDKVAALAVRGYAAARSLERRIEMLEGLVGAKVRPLPSDDETVTMLYERGVDALGYTPAGISEILDWANIFIGMGEEFLEALEAYTEDPLAWHVFYQLARNISAETPFDQTAVDRELEATYRYFEAGKRHFLNVVYFHIRNRFGVKKANQVFEEKPNDYHEEILGIISLGN